MRRMQQNINLNEKRNIIVNKQKHNVMLSAKLNCYSTTEYSVLLPFNEKDWSSLTEVMRNSIISEYTKDVVTLSICIDKDE